jgi:hypothetical protein
MNPSQDSVAPVPFAALLGAELVAPSKSPMYFVVEKNLLFQCMSSFIGDIYFDEKW